ncbi:ArsR/SmtB family transcription factor [Nakamurella leprariae]|uniref:ArsR/SmtB family transcription factor n=1 Tax=Nakamurella leprariae TaxID=2803911 RepID=UPI002E2B06FF|nr:metalloregulator ArsR/SmtB family transcription factor [Nakamurella leprariae]
MHVVTALADPVRRAIVERLHDGPQPAGSIAAGFDITRPAVSRHLQVLLAAGVVSVQSTGRERRYRLQPEALAPLADWIARLREAPGREDGPWDRHLDALATEVARTVRERRDRAQDQAQGEQHTDEFPGVSA